jgi:hypothetical protein
LARGGGGGGGTKTDDHEHIRNESQKRVGVKKGDTEKKSPRERASE